MKLKRPREPTLGECCGCGCSRCVWDVYYDALEAYERKKKELEAQGEAVEEESDSEDEDDSSVSEDSVDYIGSVVIKFFPDKVPSEESDTSFLQENFTPVLESKPTAVDTNQLNSICLTDVTLEKVGTPPIPGDVVEIFAPNKPSGNLVDVVEELCSLLGLDPEQECELHRSSFVPEGHFPFWLPQRRRIKVRSLLEWYVDLSSSSYLMRPTFFQSLLRIHENNAKKKTYEAPPEKVELLKTCASLDNGPSIFRSIMNAGNPLCYPSLIDVLGLFSFIKIPLDRLLEICGPLRPRKFSVVDYKNIGESTELQLCFRKVMADREANMKASQCDGAPKLLAETLNKIALDRAAAHKAQPCFTGLVSYKMSAVQTNMSLKLYGRTSPFGTTTFARELMKAVQASAQGNGGKLILIGAGTGVAPLIAAVNELCRLRSQHSASPPFNCTLLYGARTMRELVFNERANQALREGAIADYKFALSRESSNHPDPVEKYVTDILQKGRDTFRQDLLINSPPAKLFACGPANVLKSLRNVLEDVLGEADDDDSVRQQRILFMEDSQIFFDVWSNTGVL